MHFRFKESAWRFFLSMALFSTLIANGAFENHCPKGWHFYNQRQKCFLLEYKPMTWDQARVKCKDYGGDLTKIPDSQTNAFLKGLIEYPSCAEYWIGLHDRYSEGVYQWLDQSGPTNFTYWAHNEPNNLGDEDCAFISAEKESHWNDAICDAYIGFSCERSATNKPETLTSTTTKPETHTSTTTKPETHTSTTPEIVIDTFVGQCPAGMHYYHQRYRCFFKEAFDSLTWFEGRDYCRRRGGDLAIIPDIQTDTFLKEGVWQKGHGHTHYWIGLHRKNGGFFRWLDQNIEANYTNWYSGEPNDRDSCAFKYFDDPRGQWMDQTCHERKGVFCERAATF